jgi:phosphoribosylformylglycinamidine cyclo-ligase
VGIVGDAKRIGPDRVGDGDALVGLASSGLHANGFSLVRDVIAREGLHLDDRPGELGGRSLADELLEPTAIYAPLVARLARDGVIHAAAHVTGGGIPENLPRALPHGLGADVETTAWAPPPVFGFLQRTGGIAEADMRSTFNMGIGMILVVPAPGIADVVAAAGAAGHDAHVLGRVSPPAGVRMA